MKDYIAYYNKKNEKSTMVKCSDSLDEIKLFTRAMERAGYLITVSELWDRGERIIYNTGEEWKQ